MERNIPSLEFGSLPSTDKRIIDSVHGSITDEESYDEDDFIWSSDKSGEDDRKYSLVPLDASRMAYCFDRLDHQGILDVIVKDVPETTMKKLINMCANAKLLGRGVQGEAYMVKKTLDQSKTENAYVVKTISISKQEWHRSQHKQCLVIKKREGGGTLLAVDFWLREMIISSMAHNVFITNKTPHTLKYHWFATGLFPSMASGSFTPNSADDEVITSRQALLAMEPARGTSMELLNWSKTETSKTEWNVSVGYADIHRFSVFAFQVLQGIAAMQYKYKVMHRDLHMGNLFIQKIDDGYVGQMRSIKQWLTYHLEIPVKNGNQTTWKNLVYSLPNEGYLVKIADWGLAISHSKMALVSTKTKPGAYDPMYDVLKVMASWWRTRRYLARVFLMSDIEDVLYDLVQSFLTVINYDVNRELFTGKVSERSKVLSHFFDGIPEKNSHPEPRATPLSTTTPVLKNEHAMLVKVKGIGWENPQKDVVAGMDDQNGMDVFKRRHYFYQPSKREHEGKIRVHFFPRTHALQSTGNTAANIIANAACFDNWTMPRVGSKVATLTKFDYTE